MQKPSQFFYRCLQPTILLCSYTNFHVGSKNKKQLQLLRKKRKLFPLKKQLQLFVQCLRFKLYNVLFEKKKLPKILLVELQKKHHNYTTQATSNFQTANHDNYYFRNHKDLITFAPLTTFSQNQYM